MSTLGQSTHIPKLASMLLGHARGPQELPELTDLASGLMNLAKGLRHKVIVPLAGSTSEFAFLRRGSEILISHYDTSSVAEVYSLDRPVPFRDLLDACADTLRESALGTNHPTERKVGQRLAHRLKHIDIVRDVYLNRVPSQRTGATVNDPSEHFPLAFSFEAMIPAGAEPLREASSRADVHATLFTGKLWVHSQGRRYLLTEGPIMPTVQRAVDIVRALLDASETQRPSNIRLRSGSISIGFRLSHEQKVALTFMTQEGQTITIPNLDVSGAALPFLRLASIIIRAVIGVDRNQSRNLRISSLRDQVRRLRKTVRTREKVKGFTNPQPDRLRMGMHPDSERPPTVTALPVSRGSVRFQKRWTTEIEGLDAGSTFLCGDRLIIATPRYTIALERDTGEVIWAKPTSFTTAMMTGQTLVRLGLNGEVELCEVEHGDVYARGYIAPRVGGPAQGMLAGGGSLPPVAILTEGQNRICAIDLRTGEPRWRFTSPSGTMFQMTRSGRVLVVVCGDSAVHALDIGSGEVVWRFSQHGRFCLKPHIVGDTAYAVTSEPGGEPALLYALDLFSGQMKWQEPLAGSPTAPPYATSTAVTVPFLMNETRGIVSFDKENGQEHWQAVDPGFGHGGSVMHIDNHLVINSPTGTLSALDMSNGQPKWQHRLSDPTSDDIPRQLDPVLRGGALFVPSASVYTVRPSDGYLMGELEECDLVPDFLRVDERSWLYVAEESGYIAAFAPAPALYVVR
ncbi:MAG: PQQ-like beta-propeller repeat protein [Myxococcales bacterium]|nr:MAG: PQQ-like beta-propeller repeat protein [Myxococcales bacterium]